MPSGDDYYSYRPLLRLERPLALCGLPGARVAQTARVLTMLSGLPLVRVDDRVSHLLGRSAELEQHVAGARRRLELEWRVLSDAIRARNAPVIALSDVTLTDPQLRRLVRGHAELVHLHLGLGEALMRIRAQAAADPRRHFALREGGTASEEHILGRLRFLERLYREADRSVEIRGRSPLEVGHELLRSLSPPADPAG